MSATVISLAEVKKGRARTQCAPPVDPETQRQKLIVRVRLLQITRDFGLSMTAEQHGFLHKWGHLAP